MPLITKPNYNQIFASQAPDIDKPPLFNNPELGWAESRSNNGKPTIKQFNYLLQTLDLKALWILQNGACLPYDATLEYAEGAPVLKDGVIQYKVGSGFKSRDSVTVPTYNNAADGVGPVTGVSDGAYFNVRSSSGESYVDEYQNVGGSAVATGKSCPSASALEAQKFATGVFDTSGRPVQETLDKDVLKSVSVLDFGIIGDGTNEASKFNLAMNRARSRNMPLDLAGLTVDTGSTTLSIDVPLKNGKLKGRYQFVTKVNLSDLEVEIVHPVGFYIKGTASNIIKFPILKNVKVKYATGVVPDDAYSVYAEYTDGLQIIGGEYEVIQLIRSPNYRIINATIDGKMRNNNELIHATYTSDGGIIAFNRFINALDNIVDLYSSGAQTLFVHNQVENCGNRLGTVMELKITYSDVPENSSSAANGFARNIIISKNIFKNLKATHAVNTSVINIYSIDTRAVPSMTSAEYISDIIVSDNIFDGFDTSEIASDIRFNCISAAFANNIKIHGNIAKNISKPKLAESSAVVFLQETNDCSVISNKGCIDQCSGIVIQGINNGTTVSLNKFNKDLATGFKPKFGLFLNQFTGSNSTVLNDPIITDNDFEGSLRSVHASLAQINRGIINGKFVNDIWVGSINDSDIAVDVKNEIGSANSIYLGGASVSSGNTLRKIHVSGTGLGTAMLLSNMQNSTVDGFNTKNLALSLNITGANSSNIDIRAPKQTTVTDMLTYDASVTAANKATMNVYGLSASKEITTPIVISSKSESLFYINGASGFSLGMVLAASHSSYANGATFSAVVTGANIIEVHLVNNTAASVTVPAGFIKVRSV